IPLNPNPELQDVDLGRWWCDERQWSSASPLHQFFPASVAVAELVYLVISVVFRGISVLSGVGLAFVVPWCSPLRTTASPSLLSGCGVGAVVSADPVVVWCYLLWGVSDLVFAGCWSCLFLVVTASACVELAVVVTGFGVLLPAASAALVALIWLCVDVVPRN
ncbi:hypothetical protein A2U01_0031586, partial [Trifolium medium]|nr:hypothetical protein [Trifolium medium]